MINNHGLKAGKQESKMTDSNKNMPEKKRYYFMRDSYEIYLTQRQMEVSSLLLKNLTYKKIGARLGIDERTVECHVNMLRTKFRAKNKKALIQVIGQLHPIGAPGK